MTATVAIQPHKLDPKGQVGATPSPATNACEPRRLPGPIRRGSRFDSVRRHHARVLGRRHSFTLRAAGSDSLSSHWLSRRERPPSPRKRQAHRCVQQGRVCSGPALGEMPRAAGLSWAVLAQPL